MPRARRTCSAKIVDEDGERRNCPALASRDDNLCDEHRKEHERTRGTAAMRGYGGEHQRTRTRLMRALFRLPPQERICPLCGETMLRSERLELDHSLRIVDDPFARGDRIVHQRCNLRRPKAPTLVDD
jgi:RNA polymerase subunit RPABC4/transcription elongation factor Spt4